jgi:hypothetical protein
MGRSGLLVKGLSGLSGSYKMAIIFFTSYMS